MTDEREVAGTFLRWTFLRAMFHRGYVLVSSLYFVVVAHLSASQLVLLGMVVGGTLLLSDIPTGVWSDAFSRKWPLVVGHALLATGMVMTGLVAAFPLLVMTQILWGLGWGFSSGADVAWISDELGVVGRTDRVLAARARWDLIGGAVGMVLFGLVAWSASLAAATVASGLAMAITGLFVATRFREERFTPVQLHHVRDSWSIFQRGVNLARSDLAIMVMLAATFAINAASVITWLFPKQLISLGFPNDPVLWYSALLIASSIAGAIVLRVVERRIEGEGIAGRVYVLACGLGVAGLVILASAPDALVGCGGVLLMRGISVNVTRPVSVIWVNRRTTSDVRATVHSFLGQAESVGEILGGFGLAAVAQVSDIPLTLVVAAAMIAVAGAIVARAGFREVPSPAV